MHRVLTRGFFHSFFRITQYLDLTYGCMPTTRRVPFVVVRVVWDLRRLFSACTILSAIVNDSPVVTIGWM